MDNNISETPVVKPVYEVMDGNEAAAYVAYKCSEVCAIYPITPSSNMGEWADEWSAKGVKNVFGTIPRVMEMQSEAGAAGTIHGSLQGGALSSTFTASQGLLLMIPNMFKIAGELTPTVFHIAARTLATHALSIFGDHSDVMACRSTGWAMLFGNSPQEAMDMAMIAHATTLKTRIPFLNIFDGFRTSHELNEVEILKDEIIEAMLDKDAINAHRDRALNPANPIIRGTAQNPDVFFQSREAGNKFVEKVPEMTQKTMDEFAKLTGRQYKIFEYYGAEDADRVIVIMGSGVGAVKETVDYLNNQGEKTGVLMVRLFSPFDVPAFINALPKTVKSIAVLDRTKETNGIGEPLYMSIINALNEADNIRPKVIGGRYGLSSKEFTPTMVVSVFAELLKEKPKNHFVVGINDDVTHTSLDYDKNFNLEDQHLFRGLFYGLGADGTVSANKNSIKIIGDETDFHVQGYFVYDSKKSGSLTTSHLRFGKNPVESTYLISSANFIAVHHFNFITIYDILKNATEGATFLLNTPYNKEELWSKIPQRVQQQIIDKKLKFYAINAYTVAKEAGMGNRINTILQTCFFAISNIIPRDEAIAKIKQAIYKTYSKKGDAVVNKNYEAVDMALSGLYEVDYSQLPVGNLEMSDPIHGQGASGFVKDVLGKIIAGEGDELPVSAFPIDGTYPSGTTKWEKRNIADAVPVWDPNLCTQCGKCFLICPHACIRPKVYDKSLLANAPESFQHVAPIGKEWDKNTEAYTLQVSTDDCTGCSLCVEYCPAISKTDPGHKAINMMDKLPIQEAERANWDFFLTIPEVDRTKVNKNTVKGSQFLQPLFEFSGACSGCGETPYIKLLTQLYGERMIVANATGCTSIFGGNLPTTPWTHNSKGHGPAWANSLFEDNAEFGLGLALASNKKKQMALQLLDELRPFVGDDLVTKIITATETTEAEIQVKHELIELLKLKLQGNNSVAAKNLLHMADFLEKKSIWIIGGDGWAYDIGYGGLDHVLSTGENVNIMVLDTEVYSNTGGQTSKSSPLGASAKFSVNGKTTGKKDLAMQAIAHGTAYVAQIAMAGNDAHTLRCIAEAEAYPGPSLIIAYSHCIAHGIDMAHGAEEQQFAVKSGYWPLFHYNPMKPKGERFVLDSKDPSMPLSDFMYHENRFKIIQQKDPEKAAMFMQQAEDAKVIKWDRLHTLTGL